MRASAGFGDVNAPLRVARDSQDLLIVVAGGVGVKSAFIPTWGGTTRAVSRVIRRTGVNTA